MPIDTTRTVHVKDLHHDVQEQELFAYFSSVGQVSSVKLHRDRQTRQSLGFAFITYYNPAHAAAAVAQLHYTTLRGHPIVVMWVGEHEALDPEANLFVRNLDHSISNEQLYELFANYGRVVSAKVMTDPATQISKGYGYVQFQFATDAQVAMQQLQGYTFGQYQLQIDVFRPKGARYSANSNNNMSTSGTAAMYYDPNGNSSSYNAAYEETYDDMYYHGGGFSQAGYGDEYASYYYGDNNANNTNYTNTNNTNNTNNTVQDTSNTEPTKVHTVSIRVIDDGKGTLSDLSPSAKEWCPPTNTTATATLSAATVASLSSNLKPDSPVFIPGGVSSTSTNKATNAKKKLPMNAVVPNKDATLSVNTANTANSSNSKLSPNAPVWTSSSANNTNSLSTNTTSTSPNIAPLLPTPITAPVPSSSSVSTTNNSTNFNTFPTANFPPEASKSAKDSFSSSPLLTSLSLPPSTTTVSTGSSVPPLMTTSTSAGTPHSAISNTSTLSSSGINSLSFLDNNGANSISNNIFTPANSLLSFPLSSVTTSATTSTASSYNSSSAVTTSYNNTHESNALRLPISPSSPTTFPFSVTGASYANLTSPSRNTSLTTNNNNNDNTHINTNDSMNDDLPPMVSSSPFPFHFALSSTSTSTKSISSPETLLHKHHHHSNLPSDIHLIHSHATTGHLRTHSGIFPLTPSSPFPLSSLVSHDTAVGAGVTTDQHRDGQTSLPFASDCTVSSLQQQLQHLLLSQHRAVSQHHDTQPRDTIDPLQQLFFTVTFLQSLSSPVSSSVSSSLFGDTLLLDDHFTTLNALPSTSLLSQNSAEKESETARLDPVRDNAAVRKLLAALTPEAVPLLDNMRTHLQTLMDMCDTRRVELLRDTAAVDNDEHKTTTKTDL